MDESFNNFYPGKVSTKSYGPIKAYAANTNQGIARDYNEDRVSIIININPFFVDIFFIWFIF